MSVSSAYSDLEDVFRRHAAIGEAVGVLHWDMSVMMPRKGSEARAEQLSVLQVAAHDLMTNSATADGLDAAEAAKEGLDPWQTANLREMRRQWRHATAVPADLVEARTRAAMTCEMLWRDARPAADFAMVADALETVLALSREAGAAKAEAMDLDLYDALLDEYEPGGRAAAIDPVFEDYAAFLPDFLDRVLAAQDARPAPMMPAGPFDIDAQESLCREMAARVGMDFEAGRLDRSRHPFSSGYAGDSRITTRYDEADFMTALMAVLHETGHAMYEANLPSDWRHQPVGESRGMALHESQSLIVEMQAGRSLAFMQFVAPQLQAAFGADGPEWQADNLYRLCIRAAPDYIRVDADEVTYPAHVILRYRLERAMLSGDLAVADLPGAWNDGLESLLGIRPPDDRLGCLQDIHWYDGAWGYFPTYTLGAMAAAQFFQAAVAADPDIPAALAAGDFQPLLKWLKANVHEKASRHTTAEVLEQATGRPLDPSAFKAHLERRYLHARDAA